MQRKSWQTGSLAALFTMLVAGALFTISLAPATRVQAQIVEPTPTPSSPAWLGYVEAREAIQEQEGVNLNLVAQWNFFQDDWSIPNSSHPENAAGIDSCVSTVGIAQGRPIYFGLTYTVTALNGNEYEARVSFDLQDVAVCDIRTTPATSAPDDGDTADNGDLPDPVEGAGISGSFELGGHVINMTPAALNAMSRSGMTWVKKQLPTSAGVQEGLDLINFAQANGLKILLGVIGDKAALAADPDGYAAQYADFVGQLAAGGANAIEVWNEPNIEREWPAGQINGANYTRLLAPAYNAIKSANPNTIVVSGAPAPTGFFGTAGCGATGCNDDTFMQQMANAGAAQYMDCVGLHYNEGVLPPSAFSGDPRDSYPTRYFATMVNRGKAAFPSLPVCFTELGYLSGEGMGAPIPPGFNWTPNDPVTVAEQAAWLAEAASLSAQRGDVRMMIVWNINYTRWDSDPMGGYAIIRPDGSCPACDALGVVMGQ